MMKPSSQSPVRYPITAPLERKNKDKHRRGSGRQIKRLAELCYATVKISFGVVWWYSGYSIYGSPVNGSRPYSKMGCTKKQLYEFNTITRSPVNSCHCKIGRADEGRLVVARFLTPFMGARART
jgi:hypothetical protein